jgi:hypothetical protein
LGIQAQNELQHLASYETGVEGSAEVVAYDNVTNRAYFTNSTSNTLSIINISNVASPTLVSDVDLSTYGGGPNSVAVHNGIVAVAIENVTKTSNGVVIFFDTDGLYQGSVTVGALPDMLIFTPDGSKILVANEGEPNDDYTIDPEGTLSVIDISSGIGSASVNTIDFNAYNNKKVALQNKGVRIFGNDGNATVAQDLEPEFITVTKDGSRAYVNCQENNALVVIDLSNNAILDILPLGFKNHALGTPSIEDYALNELVANWPVLGTPEYDGGQAEVLLGGFSGLYFSAKESNANEYVFYAVPDRGPNGSTIAKANVTPATTQNLRPFKLPDYQSRIVKFTLNKGTGSVTLDSQLMLVRKDGTTPITGKGNIPGFDEVPVTYADPATSFPNADFTDNGLETYHALPYDAYGGDFEGIQIDKEGNFWMCDEYRPAVYKFQPNGTLIERYVPTGTSLLGTTAQPIGTYGEESLPAVYSKRRANRGFEGLAYDSVNHLVYAFIQSPLYNSSVVTKNNSDVIRILGIDATNGTPVSEYIYLLERNKDSGLSSARVDKMGDAVYTGNGKFLVIERDSEGPTNPEGKKYIFEISLTGATNILNNPLSADTLEMMTADELKSNGIQAVHKTKMVNLPSIGYQASDKAEGIALLPNNQIAIINDNDFGLAGAGITDKSILSILSFANDYGFDASNKDDSINITSHPTLGMYMPDAITSYEVGGKTYIVTANEGDSRDYAGYSEEVRVKDLTLDSIAYPDAATLQESENLGRLKTTVANGDFDGDQDIDQIYSYGARSFSIFDQYGNLVFDSGNQFETKASTEDTDLFNEDEGEKDGRSDDKGIEPEAVTIGEIGGFTYAFVAFERASAVVVYDITNPLTPQFIDYYTNRSYNPTTGDIAPEVIKFIPAADSPNNQNLILVGYEVSGSMGIIQVGGNITSISEEVKASAFNIYPNPAVNSVKFSKQISGSVLDINGKVVLSFTDAIQLDVSALETGVYIVSTLGEGQSRFLKF